MQKVAILRVTHWQIQVNDVRQPAAILLAHFVVRPISAIKNLFTKALYFDSLAV